MPRTATRLLGGRYRAGALIGEGAMCSVSCAKDELLGRTVAIKLLKPLFADDAEFVARLYTEARSAAKITHPHVVAVYDLLDDAKTQAIVMEYVDGGSVAEVLARAGTIQEARAIRYLRETAQALSAAHEQGVLHRDIKPSNLLLTAQDNIKVADFGLAKALVTTDLTLTQPGHMVGSVHYFSPEQAQGLPLTPASDLYSLGIVAYQLLAGTLPFQSDSAVATAVAHVTQPAPTRAELERIMSAPLAAIVERLLQKDPRLRFESAAKLEAALAVLDHVDDPILRTVLDSPTIIVARPEMGTAARWDGVRSLLANWMAAFWAWSRTHSEPLERLSEQVPAKPVLLAAALLLLLMVAALASLMHPRVAVANVTNLSSAEGTGKLRSAGLVPVVTQQTSQREQGTILSQSPAQGTTVSAGDSVNLVVSSGPPMLAVPNLVGHSLLYAGKVLQRTKLHSTFAAKITDAPANTIIEELPAAGTRVREYSHVLFVVSTGPSPQIYYSGGGDGGD